MKLNKKAEFKFSAYLVIMFLIIALMGVFSGITAAMTSNYDVNTSESFDLYLESFDPNDYANQELLEVEGSDGDGEFAEYEASFDFGEQVKETKNQTQLFIESTSTELGLGSSVAWIIGGVLTILLLVAVVFFLRGLKE